MLGILFPFAGYHMICNTTIALLAQPVANQGLMQDFSGFDSRLAHQKESPYL